MNKKKENAKHMMNYFEDIMSAAAFAEEGEFETARKVLTARHRILLVLTGMESDTKAASYALNISERIEAAIEILCMDKGGNTDSFLERHLRELKAKGIEHRVTKGEGEIKDEIIRFTEKMSDIQFVVIDSRDLGIKGEREEGAVLHGWDGLECPLVLVSGTAKG
jgi:DNA-binding transcriptional ArsR family regulator